MKAIYYQDSNISRELTVAKQNGKTVDLADDDGVVLVSACPLAESPTPGHAVVVKERKAEAVAEPESGADTKPPKKAAK